MSTEIKLNAGEVHYQETVADFTQIREDADYMYSA